MKVRAITSLIAVAGMAAVTNGQTATFTWNWENMRTGGQDALDYDQGDSARIWLDVAWDAGSVPDVRGLATFNIHMTATDAQGDWIRSGPGFNGTELFGGKNVNFQDWGHRLDSVPATWAWDVGGLAEWGIYDPATGSLNTVQAGQLGFPNSPIVNDPNVIEIWRGQFTPNSYQSRDIVWDVGIGSAGTGAELYVPTHGPFLQYQSIPVPTANIDFGALSIPVVPSPSGLALLGLGSLIAARRRR